MASESGSVQPNPSDELVTEQYRQISDELVAVFHSAVDEVSTRQESIALSMVDDRVFRRGLAAVLARVSAPTPDRDAEEVAQRFHEAYERLAPQFGYWRASAVPWSDVPEANRQLMIATVREVLAGVGGVPAEPQPEATVSQQEIVGAVPQDREAGQ